MTNKCHPHAMLAASSDCVIKNYDSINFHCCKASACSQQLAAPRDLIHLMKTFYFYDLFSP